MHIHLVNPVNKKKKIYLMWRMMNFVAFFYSSFSHSLSLYMQQMAGRRIWFLITQSSFISNSFFPVFFFVCVFSTTTKNHFWWLPLFCFFSFLFEWCKSKFVAIIFVCLLVDWQLSEWNVCVCVLNTQWWLWSRWWWWWRHELNNIWRKQ